MNDVLKGFQLLALGTMAVLGLATLAVMSAIAAVVFDSDDAPPDDHEEGDAPSERFQVHPDEEDSECSDAISCEDGDCDRIHSMDGRHVDLDAHSESVRAHMGVADVARPSTPSDRTPHAQDRGHGWEAPRTFYKRNPITSYPQRLSDAFGAHIPQPGECVE